MELIINGELFEVNRIIDQKLERICSLSLEDNTITVFIKNLSKNYIGFINTESQENKIISTDILKEIIYDSNVNFEDLFLDSMITNSNCSSLKIANLEDAIRLNISLNNTETILVTENDILYICIPEFYNIRKTTRTNLFAKNEKMGLIQLNIDESTKKIETKIPHKVNTSPILNKLLIEEKQKNLSMFLNLNENVDLFNIPMLKSILRVDKTTGESTIYKIQDLLKNKNLDINDINTFNQLKIYKKTINKVFTKVCVCDMRQAFKYFSNPNALVEKINITANKNVLYLVYAPNNIIEKNLTLKEFVIKCYKESNEKWDDISDNLKEYQINYFYVHKNNTPDAIAKCNEQNKTFEYISLKDFAIRLNITDYKYNTDVSMYFTPDRIINLNEYDTDEVTLIRIGSKNVIKACNIQNIREEDEISTGYDIKHKMCFYCPPKY